MSKPEKPYVDPPPRKRPETNAEKTMRRMGKIAKDELDKAVKDPNRLGNRGRGSR